MFECWYLELYVNNGFHQKFCSDFHKRCQEENNCPYKHEIAYYQSKTPMSQGGWHQAQEKPFFLFVSIVIMDFWIFHWWTTKTRTEWSRKERVFQTACFHSKFKLWLGQIHSLGKMKKLLQGPHQWNNKNENCIVCFYNSKHFYNESDPFALVNFIGVGKPSLFKFHCNIVTRYVEVQTISTRFVMVSKKVRAKNSTSCHVM